MKQNIEPHIIKHYIMHNKSKIEIGTHTVYDRFGMIQRAKFINELMTDDYNISKIATVQTAGDSETFMYRVVDRNDGEIHYYIVNNVKLYDENGFVNTVEYDVEFGTDNDVDAFREWATFIADFF